MYVPVASSLPSLLCAWQGRCPTTRRRGVLRIINSPIRHRRGLVLVPFPKSREDLTTGTEDLLPFKALPIPRGLHHAGLQLHLQRRPEPPEANRQLPPPASPHQDPGPSLHPPFPSSLPASESPEPDSESYDILDEVLAIFRANTFFRNFEIQGPADRLLIYGILFVSDCLTKIKPTASVRDATKDVMNLALDLNFAIPGDPGWPLNQMYEPPRDRQDAEQLRQYMSQVRQELSTRLLARVYEDGGDGRPSKWWLSFTKRKFMGKSL
ncbi:hypothetical protein jhhlp_008100 [Lomentospora prolificans]|uniref:Actin-related protein 2/3 complex subunit 3 n=1 Tax=Lomentospora prolificans TaxID=41688 RepID=A0A2N3MZJ6_9PEZI|nr:hypothetical protein jhhlp_008100 [Lomentospora prolificans]